MQATEEDEFFNLVGDQLFDALESLERVGIDLSRDALVEPVGVSSPSARALRIRDFAFDAVDSRHLKREHRNVADLALDRLFLVARALQRMEAAAEEPSNERLAAFGRAFSRLEQLAAAPKSRPRPRGKRGRGRPPGTGFERQDEKAVRAFIVRTTVDAIPESDVWDEICGGSDAKRARLQARLSQFIPDGAPRSNQRGPVNSERGLALRYARVAMAEARLRRDGDDVAESAPVTRWRRDPGK